MTEHDSQQGFPELSTESPETLPIPIDWLRDKIVDLEAKLLKMEQKCSEKDEKLEKLLDFVQIDLLPGRETDRELFNSLYRLANDLELQLRFEQDSGLGRVILNGSSKMCERMDKLENQHNVLAAEAWKLELDLTANVKALEAHIVQEVSDYMKERFIVITERIDQLEKMDWHVYNEGMGDALENVKERLEGLLELSKVQFNAQQQVNYAVRNQFEVHDKRLNSKQFMTLDSIQAQLNQLSDKLYVQQKQGTLERSQTWLCKPCNEHVDPRKAHDCPVQNLRIFHEGKIQMPIPNAEKSAAALEQWADWAKTDQPVDRLMATTKTPVDVRDQYSGFKHHLAPAPDRDWQVIPRLPQVMGTFKNPPSFADPPVMHTTLDLLLGDLDRQCHPPENGEHPMHVPLASSVNSCRQYITNQFDPSMRLGVDYELGVLTLYVPAKHFSVSFHHDKMQVEKLQ
jgi:hypothetical protein